MMQSGENGQKPQFGNFLDNSEVKYLQIANFSEFIFSTNFKPKTKKIVWAVFEKNIKFSDFGLIWRPFLEYLQIKNREFFSKIRLCDFSCKKIRKILRAFSEKNCFTNQPTNHGRWSNNFFFFVSCHKRTKKLLSWTKFAKLSKIDFPMESLQLVFCSFWDVMLTVTICLMGKLLTISSKHFKDFLKISSDP